MSSPLPSRRVPPPCWTHQETISLIQAYRDKWFSVNRSNLRSSDWDAVAASVASQSSDINNNNPPKSSLQCRHKIEKLRKRYRMEKKRCLDYPGKFFSSWDLFPLLDAMSIGSSLGSSKRCRFPDNDIGDGFRVKMLGDKYTVTNNKFNSTSVDDGFVPDPDLGLDQDLIFRGRQYSRADDGHYSDVNFALGSDLGCLKNSVGDVNSVSVAFRPKDCYGRVAVSGKVNTDNIDFHSDYMKLDDLQVPRLKAYGKSNCGDNTSNDHRNVVQHVDGYVGFPLKTLGEVPMGFDPKIYRKSPDDRKCGAKFGFDLHCRSNNRDRFEENVVNGLVSPRMNPPQGFRKKNYGGFDASSKLGVNHKVLINGLGNVKKSGIDGMSDKKVMDPIAELVSAITFSAESFLKVEKMKMEMTMEIEKMRMNTMLKHNQMILESQQQIMDAFAKAILEKKEKRRKKRKEMELLSSYEDKNGETRVAVTESESIGKSDIAKGEECEGGFT